VKPLTKIVVENIKARVALRSQRFKNEI